MFSQLAPASLFSLEGKVAFITGGAGGIASGLASGFAAAGAKLMLADRNDAVTKRVGELRNAGADAAALVFDVTDAAAVERALDETVERFGRLDIVVNNAAIIVRKPDQALEAIDDLHGPRLPVAHQGDELAVP